MRSDQGGAALPAHEAKEFGKHALAGLLVEISGRLVRQNKLRLVGERAGDSDALPLGGGLMIESGGSLVGGVGVSGAPGTDLDVACAEAGLEAIEDLLGF